MYNLKKNDQDEVKFVMPAGSDFVSATMPIGKAIGICGAGKTEESDKFPDYPICVNNGEYYFAGRFKADEPKREEKATDEPKREDKHFKNKWKK